MDSEIFSVTEQFLAALARIQKNEPLHPKLARRAALGILRLSLSSVALEAGHSRTLIGLKTCAYPKVRATILEAIPTEENHGRETLKETVLRLRNEVAELKDRLAEKRTRYAELVLTVSEYEKGRLPDGRRVNRATKAERKQAFAIVAKERPSPQDDSE